MIAKFSSCLLTRVTIALMAGCSSLLAANTPIDLTPASFTADIIAENAAPTTVTRAFGSNRAYAEDGFVGTNALTATPAFPTASTGSPVDFVSGTAAATVFRVQPYESNNVLFLPNANTAIVGTMTLQTPSPFNSLSVLVTASDAGAAATTPTVTMTLNFALGVPAVTMFTLGDWNGNNTINPVPIAERALSGMDRINTGGSALTNITVENANSYTVTEKLFDLTSFDGGDQSGRTLQSVSFSQSRTGGSETAFSTAAVAVFALSGTAIPEPGAAVALLFGAGLLATHRAKRARR